ncbi:MAG: phosphodiester glycosidase family protein [Candidatus Marinimicrobia bacterium]|nr:phosphodiester glycosidase family protein [Candidatus Neomarinimicrobiota bacterium]MDD5582832.1 phosphodiester glycosidase family protein [Candidatus Neomarinimicrobiota bacterium]
MINHTKKLMFWGLGSIFFVGFFAPLLADHMDSLQVGPGVMYYSESRDYGPFQFDILKIDLTNPYITFETVKANDKLRGFERTSSMASRKDRQNHRIVAGVNGDFYNTSNGIPIGAQISNGEIVKTDEVWQTIGINAYNIPSIADVSFSGMIISDSGMIMISNVNTSRDTDQLILYNSFFGDATGTNAYGSEARIKPLSSWAVNDTLCCIVEEIRNNQGNTPLTKGRAVLSGHGESAAYINKLSVGDTLFLLQKMSPGPEKLTQLIGGNTILIQNGVNVGSSEDRHPRTAAGFNVDSTYFFLFTVDGRQPGYSIGMNFHELGAYMLEWGVYNGINLDGGGSTTMIVRGEIKNSPSDPGGERTVSNCLLVVSTAPDSVLALLRITPSVVYAIAGSEVQFHVQGLDMFFNSVSLKDSTVIWSCDSTVGTIDERGLFVASEDTVSGYVYASVGDIVDSTLVKKSVLTRLEITPNPVILNVGGFQQMNVIAYDNYENVITFSLSDYEWQVEGDVGTITENGFFTATQSGEGSIIVQYGSVIGSVPVTVGISTSVLVDDFSDVSQFTLTGVYVAIQECSFTVDTTHFISSPSSGKLTYSLTTGGTSALYMNCNIPVSGRPDKIGIHVYGDGNGHWLRSEFKDKNGEKFLLDFTNASPGIDWKDSWKLLEANLDDAIPSWANPNAVLDYPITWTRFYLAQTSDDKKGSGVLYFDDFIIDFISTDISMDMNIPKNFQLGQNYPNPFNPVTNIPYQLPKTSDVSVKIFDLNGQLIQEWHFKNQESNFYEILWDGTNMRGNRVSTGLYIYSVQAGEFSASKKMILLK